MLRSGFIVSMVLSLVLALRGGNCELKPDLYQARKAITERYAREVGNDYAGHRSVANELRAQKRDIDKQYFEYMSAVSQAASQEKPEGVQACCSAPPDPIAHQICILGAYMQGHRKDSAAFVKGVPADKESAAALWALDEIAYANGDQGNQSALPFGPEGPVNQYLKELFRLVIRGNNEAIKKYLGLYAFADGEYAEAMEDQLETLILDHPKVVLSNWRLIKTYNRALSDLRETMSAEKKQQASSRIQKECAPEGQECTEVLALLK
jgi:hypothetical protein